MGRGRRFAAGAILVLPYLVSTFTLSYCDLPLGQAASWYRPMSSLPPVLSPTSLSLSVESTTSPSTFSGSPSPSMYIAMLIRPFSSLFIAASLDGVIAIADNKLDYSHLDSSQLHHPTEHHPYQFKL